jgi:hypothetical protein
VRSARKQRNAVRTVSTVLGLAVLIFPGLAAQAATLANRDDKDHKVTIIEGEAKSDQTLKPQQIMDKICAKGCVVRLNDSEDDEYQIEPEDMVSIEDGYLYHDAPELPAPTPGAPATPGTPPPKQ